MKNILATGDLGRLRATRALCDEDFEIYSGDDETAMELILNGARGDISVTANLVPSQMHEMCAAALAGDRARAEALNDALMPLHKGLFVEANPIPVKWALHEMGKIGQGIRLPMTPLAEPFREPLREVLRGASLL